MFKTAVPDRWNVSRDGCTKVSSLHISVMAGIRVDDFRKRLQESLELPAGSTYDLRCIRTMPNIGSKVGCGCVGTYAVSDMRLVGSEYSY